MSETISEKRADFFCSVAAREQAEDLLGSAPKAEHWFMLEYEGKWGQKAFEESELFEQLAGFREQLAKVEKARLLLIKRKGSGEGKIHFFAALSAAERPTLLGFQFDSYDELNALDLADIVGNPGGYAEKLVEEPIYLVCTNGRRDKCCARNGVPVYQTLSEALEGRVWESTHHGGHRFSANLLKMPTGLSFGQLDMGEPEAALEAIEWGQVPGRHFRGRSTLQGEAQAAEALAMGARENWSEDAFRVGSVEQLEGREWRAEVEDRQSGEKLALVFRREESADLMYVSCVGEKQAPRVKYQLISISSAPEKEMA